MSRRSNSSGGGLVEHALVTAFVLVTVAGCFALAATRLMAWFHGIAI